MPIFLAALWGALIQVLGTVVGKVLLSLGVGYIAYTGVSASFDWLKSELLSNATALPAATIGMLVVLKVPNILGLYFSTFTMIATLRGVSAAGTLKKTVLK